MFTRATRTKKKLRMAISGPSGSGKTFTALALATTLAADGKVALIDTERGSASLYADRFPFDAFDMQGDYNPENYIKAIKEAEDGGYAVLVIDSLSHAWAGQGGVLDQVNKRGGNSFTDGWGKVGTPLQNRLMDAILSANLHVIATMRVKTEYVVEVNASGKSVPRRVGLKEVQREGAEYEFDVMGVLDLQNSMVIEKSRLPELSGAIIDKPGAKLAERLAALLGEGEAPSTQQSDQQLWVSFCKEHSFGAADIEKALGTRSVAGWMKERNASIKDAMSNMLNWATAESDKTRQAAGK